MNEHIEVRLLEMSEQIVQCKPAHFQGHATTPVKHQVVEDLMAPISCVVMKPATAVFATGDVESVQFREMLRSLCDLHAERY